jgi:RNA polymerase sigma-70 factor (ECF subfamily)
MTQRRARRPRTQPTRRAAPPPADLARIEALLGRSRAGDQRAVEELFSLLYETLRIVARAAMRDQSTAHTLQPTALVNEAYVRLVRHQGGWRGRAQFLSASARAMRSVLVDHARRKRRRRRTPGGRRFRLDDIVVAYEDRAIDVLELDDLLRKLEAEDARAAHVVELRFFGGLSLPDVAGLLDQKLRSVERDWHWARVWLRANLE